MGRMAAAVLAVAACAGLAGCANPRNEAALAAPRTLVGLAKADLLACAGVPDASARAEGGEVLTYRHSQTIVEREVDWEPNRLLARHGIRALRPEVEVWSRTFGCEATFVLRDDRVAELRYDRQRDPELCYRILGACLPPVP